jgi:Tfp pilus assembly protein PilF
MNRRPGFLTGAIRRPRLLVGVVGLLVLAALGLGVAVRAVGQLVELRAVRESLRQHDAAAARARLDRYLARWPGDKQALWLAAQAARRSDACADAERFLTAFEKASGATDASRLEWALLGAQQGDFAGQEEHLRSLAEHRDPSAPAILEALAKGYSVCYRWPEATAALDRLLEVSPGHVPALLLRGTIADHQRRADAAEEDFRKAVELAPDSAAAHSALAGFLQRSGYPREAIYQFALALRTRPDDPAALLGEARALLDAAELAEAGRVLDHLLAANPDFADGLVERGRLALRLGQAAEAEPFLARAVRAAPWHRDGQRLYLKVLQELGRSEAAARCEARVAELRDEDAAQGRLLLAVRNAPDDSGICLDLWRWYRRNGRGAEGFFWLTNVVRADPGNARAQEALADYFEGAGQPRRAALHRGRVTGGGRGAAPPPVTRHLPPPTRLPHV